MAIGHGKPDGGKGGKLGRSNMAYWGTNDEAKEEGRKRRRRSDREAVAEGVADAAGGRALVVLLRGVNVGGHRTFRPAALAAQLKHLDAVNIGAAGTFVIRRPGSQAQLRAELVRRLPFETEIMICQGRDILRLMAQDLFAGQPVRPDIVRFVSVLARRPTAAPPAPMTFPPSGPWLLKILGTDDRFVFGMYRRHMKAIGYLGTLDRLFGVPVTTRTWSTITALAEVVSAT